MDEDNHLNGHTADAIAPKSATTRNVNNESVQVIVRCRPINPKESAAECSSVVNVYAQRGVIEVDNPKARSDNESNKVFTYDGVYDWNATQQSIYDETIRPLVASVLEGYNGCVFAYGQTGTGKTFTMEGGGGDEVSKGIIPRAFDQIWAHINRTTGTEFLVSVKYLEIYMEEIRDLLKTKNPKPLELREMTGSGVFVSHLHSQTCQSADDMLKAMRMGNHNRTTGSTNMNEHSSRSHAIFQISIEMAKNDTKAVRVGKLNLIDLAGSERQSKTGATGNRLKEATKINKSLSALGNVIYALAENSSHIPYRDSKLTRLLQDSLGGNSKTIMIANIGPASMNYDETIITLRYAYRAKSIKNQPVRNEDCKDAKLLELQQEIERLKNLILLKGNGKFVPSEEINLEVLEDEDVDDCGEENETQKLEREQRIEEGKMQVDELSKKLRTLEKQMVHGGKNIVDSVNENEIQLEKHQSEISARKKREIEMQQQLELEEESCLELKQVFQTLQQEVDFKREKLKRLHTKLQSVKQEITDNHDNYLRERQELTEANDDASMHLRQAFLILENFVPSEERSKLLNLAQFNEDTDNWVLKKEKRRFNPSDRPIAHAYRRPISEYSITHAIPTNGLRYRAENILDLKLDLPLRTTQEYIKPTVCPQVKAAVKNVIKQDAENNRIVIKLAPHGFSARGVSKTELEGRYNKAARNTVEVNNYNNELRFSPSPSIESAPQINYVHTINMDDFHIPYLPTERDRMWIP